MKNWLSHPLLDDEFYAKELEAARKKGAEATERRKKKIKSFKKRVSEVAADRSKQATEAIKSVPPRVTGSDDYRTKALEVNARLAVAISQLEALLAARDEEIASLKQRVADLEALGRGLRR